MSQDQDVRARVRGLLARGEEFKYTDDVADETHLVEEGILDSFDMISLLAMIEQEFGITFDPDDVKPENFLTIGTIATLLTSKLADAAGH